MFRKLYRIIQRLRIRKINLNKKADIQIADSVRLDWRSRVLAKTGTHVIIDSNVYLRSCPYGYHTGMPFATTLFVDAPGALIKIGENCRLNGVYVHAQNKIHIGNNCVIAAGVNIIDSNGHQVKSLNRTIGRDNPQPIVIGNNVWIGLNAIILKGTIIGDNCVVSANSVVKGQFQNNCIIQGNPAKCVAKFTLET